MRNIEKFHHKKSVVAEAVGFIFEDDFFNQSDDHKFFVKNKIETFQIQNTIVAETIGFRFDADLLKSVLIIIGFG